MDRKPRSLSRYGVVVVVVVVDDVVVSVVVGAIDVSVLVSAGGIIDVSDDIEVSVVVVLSVVEVLWPQAATLNRHAAAAAANTDFNIGGLLKCP